MQVWHYISVSIMRVYPCLLFRAGLSVVGCMHTYVYNLAKCDWQIGIILPIIFTGCNEVVAKVMFLLVSVTLLTGGVCLNACWDTTPPGSRPDQEGGTPLEADPPKKEAPPRIRSMNERPVRILLECILVLFSDVRVAALKPRQDEANSASIINKIRYKSH